MSCRLCAVAATLICFVLTLGKASADDRFSMAIDAKDRLVVLDAKGDQAATVTNPSIATPVTVGSTTFQVSYGRDANNLLTAIVTPSPSQPQNLHFLVLGKKIDSDKEAVVTLTFPTSDRVIIDPGYVGTVTVNDRKLKSREFAQNHAVSTPVTAPTPTAAPAIESHEAARSAASTQISPQPAPPAVQVTQTEVAGIDMKSTSAETSFETTPDAGGATPGRTVVPSPAGTTPILPPPLIGSMWAQPPPPYTSNMSFPTSMVAGPTVPQHLYWSEPVTPPNGAPPKVGVDSMKVVEVHGPVEVKLADGTTKRAEDGMTLPSGSTVVTKDGGSAAVFMGGVNSARLLPDTEAKINQSMAGNVRHTTVKLEKGTVFSRIGRRPGETQDYQVATPEGVAAARGTETADYVGTGKDGKVHHYVFVAKGTVETFVAGQLNKVITGAFGSVGSAAMPPANDTAQILQAILVALQPYDVKLAGVLARIADGTASPGDIAFYNALVNTFFGEQVTGMIDHFEDYVNIFTDVLPLARRAVNQDLQPFGTIPLTPY